MFRRCTNSDITNLMLILLLLLLLISSESESSSRNLAAICYEHNTSFYPDLFFSRYDMT